MCILLLSNMSSFGIQSVKRHLTPCKFGTTSPSYQRMTARSHRGGDGEVGSKAEHADAWGPFLACSFLMIWVLSCVFGIFKACWATEGNTNSLKQLGSKPMLWSFEKVPAGHSWEQRQGLCAGIVSDFFGCTTQEGCACWNLPLQVQHRFSCHLLGLLILDLGRFLLARHCFVTLASCLFWCGEMHGCFTRFASYGSCAHFSYDKNWPLKNGQGSGLNWSIWFVAWAS